METKTTQHTPGPWILDGVNVRRSDKYFGNIATAMDPDDNMHLTPTSEANARLIAAAPEILAVLKEPFEGAEEGSYKILGQDWMERARAVIAKAEGRKVQ